MTVLVFANDVATAAQFLADLCQLLPEAGVLPLQEGGAHRDLVLLDAASVARALGCLVVFIPARPVLLVLKQRERESVSGWFTANPKLYKFLLFKPSLMTLMTSQSSHIENRKFWLW